VVSQTTSKVGAISQCNGTDWVRGEAGWGKATGGRTVDEELGTSVVDDGEVDYELEDLHGRYVALPLYNPKHINIGIGGQGLNERNVPKTSVHQQFRSSSNLHQATA